MNNITSLQTQLQNRIFVDVIKNNNSSAPKQLEKQNICNNILHERLIIVNNNKNKNNSSSQTQFQTSIFIMIF